MGTSSHSVSAYTNHLHRLREEAYVSTNASITYAYGKPNRTEDE